MSKFADKLATKLAPLYVRHYIVISYISLVIVTLMGDRNKCTSRISDLKPIKMDITNPCAPSVSV